MNKKIIFLLLATALLLASCDTENQDQAVFVESIALNQPQLTMTVGDPVVTLTATIQPTNVTDKSLTWQSEDTRIATVDNNGRVTAVAQGQTRIWVQDGVTGASASSSITVNPRPGSVTSVSLSRPSITLGIGGMETLVATITPADATNQNVTWSSNDTNIATVSNNGLVTAIAAGTATITATAKDGGAAGSSIVTVNASSQDAPATVILNMGGTHRFRWAVPNGGCPGSVAYLWQQSSDGLTWEDAPGLNTEREYTTLPITEDIYFRRLATDDCGITFSTEMVRVVIPIWASSNVAAPGTFAANPQDAGMLFQWNRRQGWPTIGDVTGWNNTGATGTIWERENDPCPAGWRVPTYEELDALRRHIRLVANWDNTGVDGALFGIAPYQFFLPATRTRDGSGRLSSNATISVWNSRGILNVHSTGSSLTGSISGASAAGGRALRCVAKEGTTVPVTGIALDRQEVAILVGGTETLLFTIFPFNATNQSVSWSSSNPTVVTVNAEGVIQGISRGRATITVVSNCGSYTAAGEVVIHDLSTQDGVVINGVRWATRNVDMPGTFTESLLNIGMLYQWGNNRGWSSTDPLISSDGQTQWWRTGSTATRWAAINPCPDGWRVPSRQELELLADSQYDSVEFQGVAGKLFGQYPYQVFIPLSGSRHGQTGHVSGARYLTWGDCARSVRNPSIGASVVMMPQDATAMLSSGHGGRVSVTRIQPHRHAASETDRGHQALPVRCVAVE